MRYYNGARSLLGVLNWIRGVGESALCRLAEAKIGVGERAVKTGVGDCERFIWIWGDNRYGFDDTLKMCYFKSIFVCRIWKLYNTQIIASLTKNILMRF